jgi:hypothetical protein
VAGSRKDGNMRDLTSSQRFKTGFIPSGMLRRATDVSEKLGTSILKIKIL